jgi:hypothetical protein
VIVAILIGVLAVIDALLSAFRAAAGREGRIDKRGMFRAELVRGAGWGAAVVAANAAVVAVLVALGGAPLWGELVAAGTRALWIFGGFATATLLALGCWFVPIYESRIVPSILVLGPLTLLRPIVIVGGLAAAVATSRDPRVWLVAILAGASMLALEWHLGRRHVTRWRRLAR